VDEDYGERRGRGAGCPQLWHLLDLKQPVARRSVVVEDQVSGERAYHFLMEGFGRALILGMTGEDVFARLRWLRDDAAPALDAALQALGGIDCDAIMVEALRRGDELHNRNAAATSLLAELLAPALDAGRALRRRIFAFLAGNPNQGLADFIAPKDSGIADFIGAFAVTGGIGIDAKVKEFEARHDDYGAIMLKAIADRLAEAFAEHLHYRVRTESWGYAAGEKLGHGELIAEKYRGIRPAPGYR